MDAKLLVHIEVLCRLVLAHRIYHFLTHQKSTTFEKINTWVKKRIAFVNKSIFDINKDKKLFSYQQSVKCENENNAHMLHYLKFFYKNSINRNKQNFFQTIFIPNQTNHYKF